MKIIPKLFVSAVSPVFVFLFYIYIRDKYEKEPLNFLIIGIVFGVIIAAPIIKVETVINGFMPIGGMMFDAFYSSFAVAALVEESFKFLVLFLLTWRNRNLNEKFDGIVYAVFISLGFAGIENVLYVFNPDFGGFSTALWRAVFSVPSHGLFAILMGFYFALLKFEPNHKIKWLSLSIFVPFLVHGIYDFIIITNANYLMFFFVPFVALIWLNCLKKIKHHVDSSPFKKWYKQN